MKLLNEMPIWVIGYDDGNDLHRSDTGFIRMGSSGPIKDQTFLDCSKWTQRVHAEKVFKGLDNGQFFLYRVEEYENGIGRLCLTLTKEN